MTWKWKIPTLLQRCVAALLIVAAASVFRALFFGGLGRGIPFLLYFPAVTLASLYGGLSAGLVATAFSATLAYFWVQRTELLPAEFLALAIFVISGILIAGVCEAMHRSHRRAAQALGKAEAANRQLLDGIAERKRTEAALRETNGYLDNLFNYANAPIIVWDPLFMITRFNHAFETLTGRTAGEVIGKSLELLFPPALVESSMALIKKTTGGERWETVEIAILHLDGSIRTVLWNSATVFGTDRKTPVATIAQGQDITERKQAEAALRESESRFRQLAESLPQLVWTCQPDGPCDYLNRQWIEFTGVPEARQHGFGWLEQLHPDDRAPTVAAWEAAVASGGDFHVEFRIRRHDGEYRWFDTQAVRLRDAAGHTVKWFGANTDMTERKGAEDKIRQLNAELEKRVRERTAALEAANKELEAFSYSVSHDLRAPLRAMDGFSMALLKNHAGQLDDSAQHYLRRIRANSQQMAALIDDLLNLAQLTRETMHRKRVDLTAMAEKIGTELQQMNPSRVVELVVVPALTADADEGMVRVVLTNLLANAWKFTAKHAPARVEVGAQEQEGERWFFVRDNGAGFEMAYAGKLFGAFQRLHSAQEFEGNGIGLALVQRIVHRHGGQVKAEGVVGQGATIYFTLGNERN